MYEIDIITKIITTLILSILLIRVILNIIKGRFKTIYVVYFIYFVFFVLPLILDIVLGQPSYQNSPGFFIANKNHLVGVIYNLYILIPPIIWFCFSKKEIELSNIKFGLRIQQKNNKNKSLFYFVVLFSIVLIPIIFLLFAPNISLYYEYGGHINGAMNEKENSYHSVLKILTTLSIVAAILLMFKSRGTISILFILSPFLIVSFWLNGKRSIVVFAIVMIFFMVWKKENLKGIKLVFIGFIAVVSIFLFSSSYQSSVRGFDEVSFQKKYENYRTDFGRDDSLKLVIYNELDENSQILEYRGQSLLFYTTMYVPREWWNEKPLPYAQYFTSALFLTEPQLWGWGMTTSILDESIANFGILGVVLGPLIILAVCRIGDSTNNLLVSLLSIIISAYFLTVHLVAFFPMFLGWVAIIILYKYKNRKSAFVLPV